MSEYLYQAGKFNELLNKLQHKKVSGLLSIKTRVNVGNTLTNILIWRNGEIVYADNKLTTGSEIVTNLLYKLNPNVAEVALKLVQSKMDESSSPREFLSLLTRVKVLKWEKIEALIQTKVASIIEQALLYPGTIKLSRNELDFSFGEDQHSLSWSSINQELTERQNKWEALYPTIPSITAIPRAAKEVTDKIPNGSIREHLKQFVNGKDSLLTIATKLDKDPLNIARSYYGWVEHGWLQFEATNDSFQQKQNVLDSQISSFPETKVAESNEKQFTILSVDDSLIVQASIKRALKDKYKVVLSDNAVDALNILNTQNIDLVLLDVTMPDIDGLEMCSRLRKIPKFKNLPIIMVTARDTRIDKMKGQIAGTNHYLTKPFDNQQLQIIVKQLLLQKKQKNNDYQAKYVESKTEVELFG